MFDEESAPEVPEIDENDVDPITGKLSLMGLIKNLSLAIKDNAACHNLAIQQKVIFGAFKQEMKIIRQKMAMKQENYRDIGATSGGASRVFSVEELEEIEYWEQQTGESIYRTDADTENRGGAVRGRGTWRGGASNRGSAPMRGGYTLANRARQFNCPGGCDHRVDQGSLAYCSAFRRIPTVKERRITVKKKACCMKCLKAHRYIDHDTVDKCKWIDCKHCGGKHHHLVCDQIPGEKKIEVHHNDEANGEDAEDEMHLGGDGDDSNYHVEDGAGGNEPTNGLFSAQYDTIANVTEDDWIEVMDVWSLEEEERCLKMRWDSEGTELDLCQSADSTCEDSSAADTEKRKAKVKGADAPNGGIGEKILKKVRFLLGSDEEEKNPEEKEERPMIAEPRAEIKKEEVQGLEDEVERQVEEENDCAKKGIRTAVRTWSLRDNKRWNEIVSKSRDMLGSGDPSMEMNPDGSRTLGDVVLKICQDKDFVGGDN